MGRKFTSLVAAIALAVAFTPAPQAYAINREIHYTVHFVCILGPGPGIIGEWTKYCDGSMSGWGVLPNQCAPGNPAHCCETDVVFGEICDP